MELRSLAARAAVVAVIAAAAAVALMAWSPPVTAAQLHITPVIVELSGTDKAAVITLANTGSTPIYGQVRVFTWDQRDGKDVLAPTRALSATPPMMRIDPRGEQVVRLIRHGNPAEDGPERSYRVLIDEIPPPGGPRVTGVALMLRYSVPVFVSPSTAAEPGLHWRLHPGSPALLSVLNRGGRRAQISAVRLRAGNKTYDIDKGLFGYALVGRARRWTLKQNDADLRGPLTVRAIVNGMPADMAVTLSSEK